MHARPPGGGYFSLTLGWGNRSCGRVLQTQSSLNKHIREVHASLDQGGFKCQFCGKAFRVSVTILVGVLVCLFIFLRRCVKSVPDVTHRRRARATSTKKFTLAKIGSVLPPTSSFLLPPSGISARHLNGVLLKWVVAAKMCTPFLRRCLPVNLLSHRTHCTKWFSSSDSCVSTSAAWIVAPAGDLRCARL